MDEAIEAIVAKAPQGIKGRYHPRDAQLGDGTARNQHCRLRGQNASSGQRRRRCPNQRNDGKGSLQHGSAGGKGSRHYLLHLYGAGGKIEERIRQDVMSNPAWATLRAVRKERYTFFA